MFCHTMETYWCPPLKPCLAPLPCSASQRHWDPGHCRKQKSIFRCALPTLQRNTCFTIQMFRKLCSFIENWPACLHQCLNAQKEAYILLILQVFQHFLTKEMEGKFKVIMTKSKGFCFFCCFFQNTYPLNLTVSAVKNRDSQLEGCSHHWASLAYMKKDKVINLARVKWIFAGKKCWLKTESKTTFAGTDHLQDHLCSATIMKSGLLVQEPLFLHFFFLQSAQTLWAFAAVIFITENLNR